MTPTLAVLAGIALVAACSILFVFNPADVDWMGRCPFYALTGLKCPGCGTLRAIHHLLHLRFAEAWQLNPLMIGLLPVVLVSHSFASLRKSVSVSTAVMWSVLVYWVLRNVIQD